MRSAAAITLTVFLAISGCVRIVEPPQTSSPTSSNTTTPTATDPAVISPSPTSVSTARVPNPCGDSPIGPTPEELPSLIVQNANGFVKWEWNPTSKAFSNTSFTTHLGATVSRSPIAYDDGFLYALNSTHLLQYDGQLKLVNAAPAGEPVFVEAAESAVLVARNGTIESYDQSLLQLHVLDLHVSQYGRPKNADYIQVYEGVAFVVDDVYTPYYAFRVDVSDPSSLRVLNRTDLGGINAGHGPQWVNTSSRTWGILSHWSAMTAYGPDNGVNLNVLNLDNGALEKRVAIEYRATTVINPRVAAFLHLGAYASTFEGNHSGVSYGCSFDLRIAQQDANLPDVQEHGNFAFVVSGRELRVLEIAPALRLVHSQSLHHELHVTNFVLAADGP